MISNLLVTLTMIADQKTAAAVFRFAAAIARSLVAWGLTVTLDETALLAVVAVGAVLAATAVGISITSGAALLILSRPLTKSGIPSSKIYTLQGQLRTVMFLFGLGLMGAITCFFVSASWLTLAVVVDSGLLGAAYATLVLSAYRFYDLASSAR